MLSAHKYLNDAWIAINDKVYDITEYGTKHPGGNIIFDFAGKDGTQAFYKYHSWVNFEFLLKDKYIG